MRDEVLSGVERRRRWSRNEEIRILAESLEPVAKVAEVARRNDVAPSVLYSWPRQARLPVPLASTTAKERGMIDLGGGRRVRVDAGVNAKALACVLDVRIVEVPERPMIAFPSGARVWLATGHTDRQRHVATGPRDAEARST